jgi:hypothetical protein
MILHPAIIALIAGSFVITLITVYSSFIGIQIIRWWDISSGSERQLDLERKTYLVSTILSAVMTFEILSFFLFIYTADKLHPLFVGAMCATGTLYVNEYGYPALIIKILSCVVSCLWLIINFTDNRGYDYPLIKIKYTFLQFIALIIVIEAYVQFQYFSGLKGNVITSCCGTLFSTESQGITSEILALPYDLTMIVFYITAILTVGITFLFYRTGKGAYFMSLLSASFGIISIISIISFISLYFYKLPTHHCPFCLLQSGYHFVGYPLYLLLFIGTISGTGTGMLQPFKDKKSLKKVIPSIQKNLSILSMVFTTLFIMLSTYPILFSDFKLSGY